jgi:superfamily I DNA/RNA helicase
LGTITLTKKQEQCVTFKPEGSLLVRGIPGCGKSTIIMARAQYLKQTFPNDSIVILTYNRTLKDYVRQLSMKLGNHPVEASTFHVWAQTLLKETDYPHTRLILGNLRDETIRYAKNIVNKHHSDASFPKMKNSKYDKELIRFLGDEIEWIKGSDIRSREEYLNVTRSGRGNDIRVTKKNRETIYDVLEKYNELLAKHPKHQGIDSEDLARILIDKAHMIPESMRPDHILVDEAQDLHTIQLLAISKLAKKSLTVGADKGQQIYRRNFTWKKAGIDVTGNRSRFLNETFRSTKQIIRLANAFQEKDDLFTKDEDYLKAKEPEIEGKIPEVLLCASDAQEIEEIIEYIRKVKASFPEDTIGVIANTKAILEKFEEQLVAHGIVPLNLMKDGVNDMISPGVKLITFHSSKGLEFDHVIVTGLKEGRLPYKSPSPGEDEAEFLSRERKKFYVGMTRAKKTLVITSPAPHSSFIDDLDPRLCVMIRK